MANKKISELTTTTSIDTSDIIPFVDVSANETKTITKSNLLKSMITKIWEDNTVTTWHNATLGLDISSYDLLIIVPSHSAPTIVPISACDFYFSWDGYYSTQSKDAVTQRHIYKDGNDIHWGECFYRGINGATGVGNADDIDFPRAVYGIKL